MANEDCGKHEVPEKAPETCEWFGEENEENCDRNPSIDLYEYNEATDKELWVCEGHFTSSMYRTPPTELKGQKVDSGDVAEKLDELRTKHGHVIKDEEGLKQLIQDLRKGEFYG